ncbi:MAG: DegT/DnrJ/EryC1/StrS family aminotransferase [Alphaproteobacteria bacterium]|nr:DegT/DnrJ/EryC1/StrS family aminotransferase [Alphaproteobacteria bacterium]
MSYRITQVDLAVDAAEKAAIMPPLDARWLTEGPLARAFQEKIATLTGARHVFFAPNGTLGLFLAALALEPRPGDEILIPSFTFYGSATAAHYAGFKPVFVDVDPETFAVAADQFEAAIGPATRALMPVHIYGQCCDMAPIVDLARGRGLAIIEDAAQALSVTLDGKSAGTFGDIGVFSLFSDKTITTGEGGILVTDDDAIAERIRLIRNQGRPNSGTFVHPSLGMNFRITDLQAAIGLAQFGKLPAILADRERKRVRYSDGLAGVGDLRFMKRIRGSTIVPFRFPILTAQREALANSLEAAGIQTRGFFYPMHLQPKLRQENQPSLPVSERLSREGLCLPVHVHVTDGQLDDIVGTIRRHFGA